MAELVARKQTYKFNMFKKLNYILLLAVAAIFIFFVVSSFAFSNRMDEGWTLVYPDVTLY
jgi:cell division protein FtsL